MRLATLLILLSGALAGCSSSESAPTETRTASSAPAPPTTTEAHGEIRLVAPPARALARCRAAKLVAPACPTLVPDPRWRDRRDWDPPEGGIPFSGVFELSAGAEHPGEPALDRPPRLVHLVVLGGREAARFDFRWPRAKNTGGIDDGLYAEPRRRALLLDRPTWRGRAGDLVLAPGFPTGGIVGNHLILRWRDEAGFHAISLHGWEPFPETVGILRAVAESVREG